MNQLEATSASNSSIQGPSVCYRQPENTGRYQERAPTRSAGVRSPVKGQQDGLQPRSNTKVDLCSARSRSSHLNSQSSTSLGQLERPCVTAPLQKQMKRGHCAFNARTQASAVGSELVLVSTTLSSVNHVSDMEMSSALDCLPMLADWEDVALLPASQPEQSSDRTPPISDSDLDILFNAGERAMVLKESEMPSHENVEGTEETPQKSETSKSIVYKSPHTTIYNVKEAKVPGSDVSNFKLPECKSSSFNKVKASVPHPSVWGKQPLLGGAKRSPASPPAFPPAKKQGYTIHEEKPTSPAGSPARGSTWKGLSSVLTSAVNLQEPPRSGRMTPPLCKCGRRSKRLVVSNNGPNHGKAFYCCPTGKYQEHGKCGYFKWEQTLQRERATSPGVPHSSGALAFRSPKTSPVCDRNANVSTKNSLRLRPSMRS